MRREMKTQLHNIGNKINGIHHWVRFFSNHWIKYLLITKCITRSFFQDLNMASFLCWYKNEIKKKQHTRWYSIRIFLLIHSIIPFLNSVKNTNLSKIGEAVWCYQCAGVRLVIHLMWSVSHLYETHGSKTGGWF